MVVYTQREPLGVVSVITPWNFPVSIPARKIAPALIAGNTVIFKPSSDAPLSGYRLAEALVAGGIPKGVLNLITGSAADIGPAITEPPVVRAISFTGSTAAGEQIHRSVAFTTRTQMELGGKNPLIVMEDADLDKAVDLAIKGGLSLTGQACTGTSRVLVMSRFEAAFTERLVGEGEGAEDRQRHRRQATKLVRWPPRSSSKPCCATSRSARARRRRCAAANASPARCTITAITCLQRFSPTSRRT